MPSPRPEDVFLRLCRRPHGLFLDGALQEPLLGRYSFVAADPFDYIELPADGSDALGQLAGRLARLKSAAVAGLPPFQGGAAGLFSYDLGRSLETLPRPAIDEFHVPAMAVGLYDVVVAIDHLQQGHGSSRRDSPSWSRHGGGSGRQLGCGRFAIGSPTPARRPTVRRRSPRCRNPPGPVGPAISGRQDRVAHQQFLEAALPAGGGTSDRVHLRRRRIPGESGPAAAASGHGRSGVALPAIARRNPAPFAGYFDLGDFQILSASPERFLKSPGPVETRPIKGTRAGSTNRKPIWRPKRACASEKDRAENVMIVDLLRNDLSRVCRPESVFVSQFCGLESYQYVQHLVSAVRGQLRDECTAIDLLRAAFPGGSITGAPKIRAMEIIAELEPTARGAYCGSLGYWASTARWT